MLLTSDRDAERLVWGLQVSGIVNAALELSVFDVLSELGQANLERLATTLQIDPRGGRILLDALAALGLVARKGGAYSLTESAKRYLLKSGEYYVGDRLALFNAPAMWEGYKSLADAVRRGGTVLDEHAESSNYTLWDRFAEITTRRAAKGGQMLAELLAKRFPAGAELRVLDVACGTGFYGFGVAQKFSRASLTCVDLERVLARTRTYAEKLSLTDRTSFLAGDMFETNLGGPYDIVIASHVFHHFDDERSSKLMRRLAEATRPGGILAVHDFMFTDAAPVEDPDPHLFATVMLASTRNGDTYSVERFRGLLKEAGYVLPDVPITPTISTKFLFAERQPSA